MDFVSRLKQFLELKQIPITQFADNCRIPRPTLSQLLNGRNKKVSDEVIGKIHDAYPTLSVLWLMFGEGEMFRGEITDPTEAHSSATESTLQEPEAYERSQMGNALFEDMFNNDDTESKSEILSDSPTTIKFPQESDANNNYAENPGDNIMKSTVTAIKNRVQSTGEKKQIVNIIVYYDDNSFEAFVPGPGR